MNKAEIEKEVKRQVHSLRFEKGYVCSVDVLMGLGCLSKKDYEAWRFGKIDFLEKACNINLSKLSFINKMIKKFAFDLNLESSWTGYTQYGKEKKRRLKFSKSGEEKIENAYATHYIDKERLLELRKMKASV